MGSAKASGATVTIIGGGVDVRADITVPAGVTLDVTAENAKLSLHNVTLTVNGTVNADPGRIRLEDTADWGTLKGSGTIRLAGKGSLLYHTLRTFRRGLKSKTAVRPEVRIDFAVHFL